MPSEIAKQRAENAMRSNKNHNIIAINKLIDDAIVKAPKEPYPHRMKYDFAIATGDYITAQLAAQQLTHIQPHRSADWLRLALTSRICNAQEKQVEYALAQAQLWYPTNPQLWLTKAILAPQANLSTRQIQRALNLKATITSLNDHQLQIAIEPQPPFPIAALNNANLTTPDGKHITFTR